MEMTNFCEHLYDESTDGYIQILKLNDENNSSQRTIRWDDEIRAKTGHFYSRHVDITRV